MQLRPFEHFVNTPRVVAAGVRLIRATAQIGAPPTSAIGVAVPSRVVVENGRGLQEMPPESTIGKSPTFLPERGALKRIGGVYDVAVNSSLPFESQRSGGITAD